MACQEITKFSQQTEFKNFGYSITDCDGSIIIKATYITEPVFKYWNNNTTSKVTKHNYLRLVWVNVGLIRIVDICVKSTSPVLEIYQKYYVITMIAN